MDFPSIIGILLLFVFSGLIATYIFRKNKSLSVIFAIAFVFRVIIAFLQEYYAIFPYVWDENVFYSMGLRMEQYFVESNHELPFQTLTGVPAFGSVIGILMTILGTHSIIIRLFNALIGAGLVILTFNLAKRMKIKNTYSIFVATLVGLTPSYMIYSTLIMRDILIWMMFYWIITEWVKAIQLGSWKHFFIGILLAFVAIPFRHQYAPIFAVGFFCVILIFIFDKRVRIGRYPVPELQAFATLFMLSGMMIAAIVLIRNEVAFAGNEMMLEYFQNQLSWRAIGGSSYLSGLEYHSVFDVVKYMPLRFIYFTFGPFLWTSGSPLILLSALEALIGWVFFGILLVRIKQISDFSKFKAELFLLIFSMAGLLASATIDSNFGTAMRHRMIFMPFVFIVALSLLQHSKSKRLTTG